MDPSAISVVGTGTLPGTATNNKEPEDLNATAAIKEVTWLEIAPKVIERIKWSVINVTKLVTLRRSAKVQHYQYFRLKEEGMIYF